MIDMLRSILAQFEYIYQVCDWDKKGVPFKTHFYVPEVHPITGAEFHKREDDAHVLKVQYHMYTHKTHTCTHTHTHTHTHT